MHLMTGVGPTFKARLAQLQAEYDQLAAQRADLDALLAKRKAEKAASDEASITVDIHTDPVELAQQKILHDAQAAVIAKIESERASLQHRLTGVRDSIDAIHGQIANAQTGIARLNNQIDSLVAQRDARLAELAA
jgi:chromosome segregation ATPase